MYKSTLKIIKNLKGAKQHSHVVLLECSQLMGYCFPLDRNLLLAFLEILSVYGESIYGSSKQTKEKNTCSSLTPNKLVICWQC